MNVRDVIQSASSAQSLISMGLGVVMGLIISLVFPDPVAAVAIQQEAIAGALVGKSGLMLVDPNDGNTIPPCNGKDRAGSAVDPACGYSIKLNDEVESLLRVLAVLIEKSQPVVTDSNGVQETVRGQRLIYHIRWDGSRCELWHTFGSGGSATRVCIRYKRH